MTYVAAVCVAVCVPHGSFCDASCIGLIMGAPADLDHVAAILRRGRLDEERNPVSRICPLRKHHLVTHLKGPGDGPRRGRCFVKGFGRGGHLLLACRTALVGRGAAARRAGFGLHRCAGGLGLCIGSRCRDLSSRSRSRVRWAALGLAHRIDLAGCIAMMPMFWVSDGGSSGGDGGELGLVPVFGSSLTRECRGLGNTGQAGVIVDRHKGAVKPRRRGPGRPQEALKAENGRQNVKSARYRPILNADRRRQRPAPTYANAHPAQSNQNKENIAET